MAITDDIKGKVQELMDKTDVDKKMIAGVNDIAEKMEGRLPLALSFFLKKETNCLTKQISTKRLLPD